MGEHTGVTKDAAVQTLPHGVHDLRRNSKFHVGHPHMDELVIFVGENLFRACVEDITAEAVGLEGVGILTINDLIKIVHDKHSFSFYFLRCSDDFCFI